MITALIDIGPALRRGWALTPLAGKRPTREGWQTEPPLDAATLERHSGNFGLRTGSVSGVCVVDVDLQKGGKVPAGLPPTVTVVTGGGGKHFYFKYPQGIKLGNRKGALPEHVDFRGDGGQVVYPGSVHPETGAEYDWEIGRSPGEIPLAPLPQWVIDAVTAKPEAPQLPTAPSPPNGTAHAAPADAGIRYARAALDKACGSIANTPEGSRNQTLNDESWNIGGLLHVGLPESEAQTELVLAAITAGLPEAEARTTVQSGLKAGKASPRTLPELRQARQKARQSARPSPKPPAPASADTPTAGPAALLKEATPPGGPIVGNFVLESDGEKERKFAVPIANISKRVFEVSGNWPRRVGELLFVAPTGQETRWLRTADSVFAWLRERATVQWGAGSDSLKFTLTTKGEFFAHLQAVSKAYDGVTTLPYEPALPRYFCAWQAPDYAPDGHYLDQLLSYFDNAETPHDAALIRAMFITPAWGGLPGARPAFLVTAPDRGYGKTELISAVGALYGGIIEGDLSRKGEGELFTRLLSPAGLLSRIIRIDNIRATIASGTLEALLTFAEISGRQLYAGEGKRPNYLTCFLTANTPRLSRDIAERSIVVKLRKPRFRPGWKEDVFGFIEDYRHEILSDALYVLRGPTISPSAADRWQSWVDQVLCRCTPAAPNVVAVNQQRRNEYDEDLDEATRIYRALSDYICQIAHQEQRVPYTMLVPSTSAMEAVNRALGEHWTTKKLANVIKSHIAAGRLPHVKHDHKTAARGYTVTPESVLPKAGGYDGYDG